MKKSNYTNLSFAHKLPFAVVLLAFLSVFLLAGFAYCSQAPTVSDSWQCDIWYNISNIELRYQYRGQSSLPSLEQLYQKEYKLFETDTGYTGYRSDNEVSLNLADLTNLSKHKFHFSAVKTIQDQLVKHLNSCGIGGVVILPASGQLDLKELVDLRPGARLKPMPLIIDIWVAQVVDVSIKSQAAQRKNLSASNSRIIANSPIQADNVETKNPNSDPGDSTDLIISQRLDDYLYMLNRHPGRRVDAAITPADKPGEIGLEYNVRQNKPDLAYAQISNTGSKDTNDFRQRYGYVNNQFTGNDDIFNIDYLTTDFSDVHSLALSYDRPWFDSQLTRIKLFGSYSDYVSSEIGSESYFSGKESTAGFEFSSNVYQKGRLFIDRFAGLRLSNYKIENYITEGEHHFADELMIVPSIGYRLEYDSGISRTFGQVGFEANLAGNSADAMEKFGRNKPDGNWWKFNWNINHSFYLEPVWDPVGWRDVKTPKNSTLAHEISLSGRGQYTRSRLIPQEKMSVGGLYTVRGYRQSFVSGDNVMILSGEYRYHIPRAFDLAAPVMLPVFGSKFRWAPEQVYGFPDWDLIFKTFVDGGFTTHNDMTDNEDNYGLLSGGVGMELQFNRYFSVRCDYGIVIEGVEANDQKAERGDGRFHISGMIAY